MRDTHAVHELWEALDIIDRQIADLKAQRDQLDDYLTEAITERLDTLRQLSAEGVEPEYA